jgi:hypothetical protein
MVAFTFKGRTVFSYDWFGPLHLYLHGVALTFKGGQRVAFTSNQMVAITFKGARAYTFSYTAVIQDQADRKCNTLKCILFPVKDNVRQKRA